MQNWYDEDGSPNYRIIKIKKMSHLKEQNETYLQHLRKAMCFAGCLLVGSACAFIHAFIPCMMTNTTSKIMAHIAVMRTINE